MILTYFDTSALLKLLVEEDRSDVAAEAWSAADVLVSSRLVIVEARAALASANRDGRLTGGALAEAKTQLSELAESLTLVEAGEEVVDDAGDLAEQEALRGYDAVHLATALAVDATVLATDDKALVAAAARRGLHIAVGLSDDARPDETKDAPPNDDD